MNKYLNFFLAFLICCSVARADITWLPAESTYNGTPFTEAPGFPGAGFTSSGSTAYGAGGNSSSTYVMGFANSLVSSLPTFAQSDLSSTVLIAGTALVLEFSKGASDEINFIAMLADPSQTVSYEIVSSTRLRIRATIVDPVQSASGDSGSAFGLLINYAENDQLDFGGTVFITNMHYLDIQAPSDLNAGTAGINLNGTNGVAATVRAFLPLQFLNSFGVTEANISEVQGYIDGSALAGSSFTNLGLDSSLGFDFKDTSNPSNTVLKVEISNSSWSPHTIGVGRLDETAPTLTITGKSKRNVKSAEATVKGTVTDTSGVESVFVSTKSKKSGFKKVKLKNGNWSAKISALRRGKTTSVYFKATDVLGNSSSVQTVKITRN